MPRYTSITIIYNPNSTGSGKKLARELKARLHQELPGETVELMPTEHAGHGERLAYDLAKASAHPLIISASGDGGYHEVVNGLIKAQTEGANPVGGLLPAGNANDHYHHLHDEPVAQAITAGHEQTVDLLRLSSTIHGRPFVRYAHSYIGIGLTPKVGAELNKTKLNRLNEAWIVLKGLFSLQPVHIMVDGQRHTYDSLVFSNIKKMSKVLRLSHKAKVDDGKFEVTGLHRRNKLALISMLLKASTTGPVGAKQTSEFRFTTIKETLVQLDGEIVTLDAGVEVILTLESAALRTIV